MQVGECLLVHPQAPRHQQQVKEAKDECQKRHPLLHDDEHGLVHHLQHLHLQQSDDEGPQLFKDCEKESSSLTNYSTVFKKSINFVL